MGRGRGAAHLDPAPDASVRVHDLLAPDEVLREGVLKGRGRHAQQQPLRLVGGVVVRLAYAVPDLHCMGEQKSCDRKGGGGCKIKIFALLRSYTEYGFMRRGGVMTCARRALISFTRTNWGLRGLAYNTMQNLAQ